MKQIELCTKRKSILEQAGHLLVLGGPGAGKTTIALLKAKRRCAVLRPGQEILFLSFSRAAVRQIVAGCENVLTRSERSLIQVKTYHSFCLEMLESQGRMLHGKSPKFLFPSDESIRRADFAGDWNAERQRLLEMDGVFCFDTFAGAVATLFERCPPLRTLISDKYPMVIVDEFQDTDNDQWRLVRALAGATDLFCLADPEQRIFDYRASVDPKRLDLLRETVRPTEFDFQGENRRSSGAGGILNFADAILFNRAPLPSATDVQLMHYYPNAFGHTVHAAVGRMFGKLRSRGIIRPCVAVLARTNGVVMQISGFLAEEHVYSGTTYRPIEHEVAWDANLAFAAAGVVGSVLEWQDASSARDCAATMRAIAAFYRMKNAAHQTKSAIDNARRFEEAAQATGAGGLPKVKAGKELLAAFNRGLVFQGDPVRDWLQARGALEAVADLKELSREVRLVRLFRAKDALAKGLAERWLASGTYEGAAALVKRVLERERLVASERDPDGCVLMNMHKSKGKEFDGVVLVEGTYGGAFFGQAEQHPFQQSRRLLRVAITRARSLVTIVRPHGAKPLVG